MSFRLKTIFGVVIIEAVLLLVLIWNSLYLLSFIADEQLQYRARTTATLFASTTADAVLSFDLASLESAVSEVLKNPGIVYARVMDNQTVLAEGGDKEALNRAFSQDINLETVNDNIFDMHTMIRIANMNYGRVEIGLEVSELYQQFERAKRRFLFIAGSEMVLTTLFSLILGSLLTSQLKSLKEGTEAISSGRFGYQVKVRGRDEIADAVRAFNSMSSNLSALMEDNQVKAEKLKSANEFLSGLIDNLPSGVLMTDSQGKILHANAEFYRLLGLDISAFKANTDHLDKIIQTAALNFAVSEHAVHSLRTMIYVGMPLKNQIYEMRDGRFLEADYRPMTYRGLRYADLINIRDITDRVIAQQQERIRRNQLDIVFRLSPDGFVYYDSHKILSSVNEAFLMMTKTLETDWLNIHYDDFFNHLSKICNVQLHHSEKGMLVNIYGIQTKHLLLDERSLDNEIYGERAHVMYFRDVTREVELDQMKSDFMATAAHELRTPMANVFGFTELLLNFAHDEAIREEMLETIHEQSRHLVQMLNVLLDLARIEARAIKDFDIQWQSLEEPLKMVVNAYANKTEHPLKTRIPQNLPEAKFDSTKFQQLLNNIISNAYKYSPDGGDVSLVVDLTPQTIEIRVTDQGIGMSEDQIERVFERFYRVDKAGTIPGSGLGMSLVKEIANIHGWKIKILSTLGQGTTVSVSIPRQPEEQDQLEHF